MLCGHTPTHSPRYFAYLHHKEKEVVSDFSYNKFSYCDDNCQVCTDKKICTAIEHLKEECLRLESDGLALTGRRNRNDWIAGDIVALGWVIVRNGVVIDDKMNDLLAHDFQTLLLTTKFGKQSANSAWVIIDSPGLKKETIIPGSFRCYNFLATTMKNKSNSLVWGHRKMIPYLNGKEECNLRWFREHGFSAIAEFFETFEKNWTENLSHDSGDKGKIDGANLLSNIVGVEGKIFNDYRMSGQCIIANFGFVREQAMHMDYVPIFYP